MQAAICIPRCPDRACCRRHAAVVRTLRSRVTVGRQSERAAVFEERVLLLDAEHRLLVAVLRDHLREVRPDVGRMAG